MLLGELVVNMVMTRERQIKPMPNELRIRAMADWTPQWLLRLALLLGVLGLSWPVLAQQQPSTGSQPVVAPAEEEPEIAANEKAGADVIIDGRTILTVYQPIGATTPQERAERIARRIIAVAEEATVPPESVSVHPGSDWTEISAGSTVLMAVTDVDAKMAGKPRKQVASEAAGNIRQALVNYRRDHSWNATLRAIIYTLVATAILLAIAWAFRKVRLVARSRFAKWIETRKKDTEGKKTALQVGVNYALSLAMAVATVIRWLLLIALFQAYATVVLSFYPGSRYISHAINGWILAALTGLGQSALDYIPDLVVIAVVAAVASQVIRLISMIFGEIGKGNLAFPGFYPEWAEPTSRLIRMLVLVLVVIIIFPYLPGAKSPAFQGISIFVGVLLSLGSSSAVANAIAGIILTYMRSFAVGDWVRIGDTVGEVVEKNMLVTRIVTQKREIITIPNATVMNGSVMNYTREAKNGGVIFHTTVTIGYDASWKTVHQLLMDAARATEHILHTPAPFVLQTALNDFYVSYELNAYTDVPVEMQFIYSELHENIQDRFNEAGVEICSPHFSSLRDGNTIAIPAQNRPPGYTAPAFRVSGSRMEEQQTPDKSR
jgi:small-conductance mechanosensitive channel